MPGTRRRESYGQVSALQIVVLWIVEVNGLKLLLCVMERPSLPIPYITSAFPLLLMLVIAGI